MRLAPILSYLLLTGGGLADTLNVLVLEVDRRLVQPTYERAVSGDPESLADAIGKMRKLVPDKGVKEWLELEVEWVESPNRLEIDEMKHRGTPRGGPKRFEVGHAFTWSRNGDLENRTLKLSEVQDQDKLYRFTCQFNHRLDDHWSLSGAVATPAGALFVFEKLSTADPEALNPRWVLSTLLEKKGRAPKAGDAVERLTNPPLGRSAMVRVPDTSIGARIEFDHAVHTDYSEGFTKSSAIFTAAKERSNPQLNLKFPVGGGVELDLVMEKSGTSLVTHSGKFAMPLEENPSLKEFEALHRDKTREGSRTRSVPSKRKKPGYYLESHLIEIPVE
ncbi:MAG: hypothetical protein AAGI48_16960 [Verrucomicrobiota bacterium]